MHKWIRLQWTVLKCSLLKPPHYHHLQACTKKIAKHGTRCIQNNQLQPKSHVKSERMLLLNATNKLPAKSHVELESLILSDANSVCWLLGNSQIIWGWVNSFFSRHQIQSTGGRKVGTHQGNCKGQLALVATTVGACHTIDVIMKPNCFNEIVDNLLHIVAGDTLQAGIHVEMLPGCHKVQQWIELGAVSHLLLCRSEVTRHRMPVDECITPCRLQITTQDWQSGCFAGSVDTSASFTPGGTCELFHHRNH